MGGEEAFEIDHFRPKKKYPKLVGVYANLYYACRKCNGHKWETWPADDQAALGMRFADPCAEDPYLHHLCERDGGALEALTLCGAYSNDHIRLDRPAVREWRRLRNQARRDLPVLTAMVKKLEDALDNRADVQNQIDTLKRRIEDSRLRFSIDA